MSRLPINDCLDEIVQAVARSVPVVLKAPPGAGKTTGVPPALMQREAVEAGQLLLVQPRRMAARAAARRVARLMNTRLGDGVGYHVRFDRRVGRDTRLIAMTTGVLLRRLQSDPLLEDVSCVLLDEFHERSLEADLALGMLHRLRTAFRPELKLVVMSATLDPEPIVDFLGEAAAVESVGRSFPVDVRHASTLAQEPIDRQVANVVPEVMAASTGHVLVFLPGVGEIRRTHRTLQSMPLGSEIGIFDLYGDLPAQHQDAVLEPSAQRRIILSTNVAETSITIPGVTAVIDSGLARVMRFDSRVGMPKLQLEPISQASAEQRAGRAGRTEAGLCYRLWPAAMHRSRRERDTPEVRRGDLSAAVLMLAAWGERDLFSFPWLTTPPQESVNAAKKLLGRLGALDAEDGITEMGQRILKFPLHPRLARFMIEAARYGVESDAALVAALLTERDPFRAGGAGEGAPRRSSVTDSNACDLTDRLQRLKAFFAGDSSMVANEAAAKQIRRVADQIVGMIEPPDAVLPDQNGLRRALLAAYSDRVARRRDADPQRGVMMGGRGVRLDSRSGARTGELFLCIDVDSKSPEATVRLASAIDPSWLDPDRIRQVDEPFFDSDRQGVVVRRRRYLEDLLLSESPIQCEPSPQVAKLLADQARENLELAFPPDDKRLRNFILRVRFLSAQMPQLDLPPLDDDAIGEVLGWLCERRTQLKQLQSAPWLDHVRGRYNYGQLQLIDQHAPERIVVPSGNSIAVDYSTGNTPLIRVRIQELYGWSETPRLAGGRVAVQLHLLGPNHRPQQITDDLANFWKTTYKQVRKDLRGRYPKHHWPEDPTIAKATRNGLKPKS